MRAQGCPRACPYVLALRRKEFKPDGIRVVVLLCTFYNYLRRSFLMQVT